MAKYSVIQLKVDNGRLVGMEQLSKDQQNALNLNNAIYVYHSSKTNKIYVGQTIHFVERNAQHYDGSEEKFNTAKFDEVIIIFSKYFNRSALDDVESQLITYFVADQGSKKENVEYETEVINRTGGNTVPQYAERELVATEVVLPVWEKEIATRGWAKTKTLNELREKALVKYSPIKVLTPEQNLLITEIIDHPNKTMLSTEMLGLARRCCLRI
jgi:predicted GIY-YIG superfamily endonuclease